MEKAREWEIAEAREQGKASALADIKSGKPRWPMGTTLGLSGKHKDIHRAWCEAKAKALEAHGYQRPKRLAKSSGHV